MMTEQEKRAKKDRSSSAAAAKGKRKMSFKRMREKLVKNTERKSRRNATPATCLLRPVNIVGGAFMRGLMFQQERARERHTHVEETSIKQHAFHRHIGCCI
jgi:hypothetical protein